MKGRSAKAFALRDRAFALRDRAFALRDYDAIDRRADVSPLAIASTRGRHALCDAPQSWPPVLRMK